MRIRLIRWQLSDGDDLVAALAIAGHDVAIAIRRQAATRHVPLVFIDGTGDEDERIAGLLPEAICCRRDGVADALISCPGS